MTLGATGATTVGGWRQAPNRTAAKLAGAVWLVYLATAGGTLATGDAVYMYEQAKSILERGAVDVPPEYSMEAWRGPDGRYFTPFGIGQSLYDIPFILLGRMAVAVTGLQLGDPDTIPKAAVALGSTVTAAVTIGFAFLLAWRLSGGVAASAAAALLLAFGTLLWPYSKFGFNATLTAAALTAGMYGMASAGVTGRLAFAALGSCALGAALLTRHEMTLAAVVCMGWLFWRVRRDPRRTALLSVAAGGVIVALVVFATFNWARFGSPLWTGHRPVFSGAGWAGFSISPSGSLLLYSPPAIAVLSLFARRYRRDPVSVLILATLAALVIFYASLDDWLGTRSYGPRYLVPLLPLFVAPTALRPWPGTRLRRLLLAALCATSVLVQLPAIVVDFSRAGIAAGQPPQTVRRDDWRWAPIRLTALAAARAVPANIRDVAAGVRSAGPPGTAALSARLERSLDFWWLYLYHLGVWPRWCAALAAILPLAAAAALLANVARDPAVRSDAPILA